VGSDKIISDCIHKGFLNKKSTIKTIKKSKILLVPSLIESYSIVSIECPNTITLITKNSGISEFINPFFVLDSYDSDKWIEKINLILNDYDYYEQIYFNNFKTSEKLIPFLNEKFTNKNFNENILFVATDNPFVGGAGTNVYNMIKVFENNAFGLFINDTGTLKNPHNIANLFCAKLDIEIEKKINIIKSDIEKSYGKISIVFCKNYKVCSIISKIFNDCKIIFSPSGLRELTSLENLNFVSQINFNEIKFCNKELVEKDNIYDFIKINDKYLDLFAMQKADLIVPNSELTYSIIYNSYPNIRNKLAHPIYLSNINHHKNNIIKFNDKTIDVVFCAYSWKRKCKNLELAKKLLLHDELKSFKKIIIGLDHKIIPETNLQTFNNLDNDKLFDVLQQTKVIVIPSFYDSSPNILFEGITANCNIVTTTSVGNHENLDPKCIVRIENDIDEWIIKIKDCCINQYKYYGPSKQNVKLELINIFQKIMSDETKKKAIGIYKIPGVWNDNYDNIIKDKTQFIFTEIDNKQEMNYFFYYDMYFKLFIEMCKVQKTNVINYIICDNNLSNNTFCRISKFFPTLNYDCFIWKIKDLQSLMNFNNGDFYFVRGTYYNIYKDLIPSKAYSISYPATSLVYEYDYKIINDIKIIENKYLVQKKCDLFDITLIHEDDNYNLVYKNSLTFKKFCTDNFVFKNKIRIFDFCFVATHNQLTKNHSLFFEFMKYLDKKNEQFMCVYVGNIEYIKNITKNNSITFKNIKLLNFDNLTPDDLTDLYNLTRINLLFSGRDAYPRVILESGACGCFNVALDTLSDGKNYYDEILGKLIGNDLVNKQPQKAKSISYTSDDSLWENIYEISRKQFDHKQISLTNKQKYNWYNCVQEIISHMKSS